MPINNVDQLESNFFRALGDGKKAAIAMRDMIKAVTDSRDTTVLCRAMKRALSKGDEAAAKTVGFCATKVWPGAKVVKSEGNFSIKIKGIAHDNAILTNLDEAIERAYSIRGATFANAVAYGFDAEGAVIKPEPAAFDPEAAAEKFAKGHTTSELEQYINALIAKRGMTKDAVTEPTADPALTAEEQAMVTDAE